MANNKDLIISACANYTADKIEQYINSIDQSGFEGDKIMICYNLSEETHLYLKRMGWGCVTSTLQGHPHMKRLIDTWYVLEQNPFNESYRYVITTDVRDVVFQTNPSDWLNKFFYTGMEWNNGIEVIIASEGVTYSEEQWGMKNMYEGYGETYLEWIKPKEIGNVGIILGKAEGVKNLLQLNYLVSQAGNTQHFTDQSSLNLIIHNELVKDKIRISKDVCLQVGARGDDFEIQDNKVMNGDEAFPIVHQYDRSDKLNSLYKHYKSTMPVPKENIFIQPTGGLPKLKMLNK
jgi:hypothetical protein